MVRPYRVFVTLYGRADKSGPVYCGSFAIKDRAIARAKGLLRHRAVPARVVVVDLRKRAVDFFADPKDFERVYYGVKDDNNKIIDEWEN